MSATTSQFHEILIRAQEGDVTAFGVLIEEHRDPLRNEAMRELGEKVRVRTAPSDVVQQTCLSAFMKLPAFLGKNKREFAAWLQQIHSNNLKDCVREHFQAECRTVNKEVALDDPNFFTDALPNLGEPPPEKRALDKRFEQLEEAISRLPVDQQLAVRMRHLENRTLEEIADTMKKSKMAVASLITRGLRNLRSTLSFEDLQDDYR